MEQIKNRRLLAAISLVLKDLRESKKLSQGQLNDEFKIQRNLSINSGRIESGKHNISVSTLYELCIFFKISISIFLKEVEKKDPTLKME